MIRIGNLEIENNIFLAPMAGVTDLPFRRLCKRYGCGFSYTEMVSAKGLYYKDKKTDTLMKIHEEEKPCGIQIFGSDPDIMASVVKVVENAGAALIDINMGCPTPKIVNNGDGSALMKNKELVGKIVRKVSAAATVPVTVKIRKGWDEENINAVEVAKIAEENGACAITVHGRTREQFYSGNADWDIIAKVKQAVKIPVIGNGDIFTAQAAADMLAYTGCDGVMVARGAQGNPFIFKQINEFVKNGTISYIPQDKEKIDCTVDFFNALVDEKGEIRGVKEARKHIAWFIKGMKNSAELKNKIFSLTSPTEINEVLLEYKSTL